MLSRVERNGSPPEGGDAKRKNFPEGGKYFAQKAKGTAAQLKNKLPMNTTEIQHTTQRPMCAIALMAIVLGFVLWNGYIVVIEIFWDAMTAEISPDNVQGKDRGGLFLFALLISIPYLMSVAFHAMIFYALVHQKRWALWVFLFAGVLRGVHLWLLIQNMYKTSIAPTLIVYSVLLLTTIGLTLACLRHPYYTKKA